MSQKIKEGNGQHSWRRNSICRDLGRGIYNMITDSNIVGKGTYFVIGKFSTCSLVCGAGTTTVRGSPSVRVSEKQHSLQGMAKAGATILMDLSYLHMIHEFEP